MVKMYAVFIVAYCDVTYSIKTKAFLCVNEICYKMSV